MDPKVSDKIDLLDLSLRGRDQASQRERIKTNTISTSTHKRNVHADICYGFRCSKKSTEKIKVNAGSFGEITLYLCSVCATKFKPQEM